MVVVTYTTPYCFLPREKQFKYKISNLSPYTPLRVYPSPPLPSPHFRQVLVYSLSMAAKHIRVKYRYIIFYISQGEFLFLVKRKEGGRGAEEERERERETTWMSFLFSRLHLLSKFFNLKIHLLKYIII